VSKVNKLIKLFMNNSLGVRMKNLILLFVVVLCSLIVVAPALSQNKYVGVKQCSMCHKADKTGNQFGVWSKSLHAEAYKVLTSDKAKEVAKKAGLKKPAAESPECLGCHTVTADAKLLDKTFDVKEGVTCEACHGAGSAYKSMSVMKDKAKAITAGLVMYKDEKEMEKKCVTCHNDKSPTFKGFKFSDAWPKIKHAKPKS